VTDRSSSSREEQFRKCALLVALYAIPPFLILAAVNVLDADMWWHLRTGQWIVEHRAVPHSDSFSWTGVGQPWAAYSWLFELLIFGLFRRFGLIGILGYTYAMVLAIAIALHLLIRKFEHRLAQSVGLTALALVAMTRVCSPRPWLFTILFLCLELNVLVSVRRSRNFKHLLLLLPLFCLWANLHIQFLYGFCVLGAAAIEEPVVRLSRNRWSDGDTDKALPFRWMVLIIVGSMLAIVVNPYHFHIYSVLVDTMRLGGLYNLISELQALPFRSLQDWLVLLLVLGAAFVMGRAQKVSVFWLLLFVGSAFVSFRGIRDVWFVVVVAVAIIARYAGEGRARQDQLSARLLVVVCLATVLLLGLTMRLYRISNPELQKSVAEYYPAAAVAFVEERQLSGPLYNHFNWGGYLIWNLPRLPVSMDGRSNIHYPNSVSRAADVWNGKHGWRSDNELSNSRLVIAQKDAALTQLLRLDYQWRVVYEDSVAAVFVREGNGPSGEGSETR
jgi:hypothetical protein